jgi:hypothetical protein
MGKLDELLGVTQLMKKFTTIHGTLRFITVFTRALVLPSMKDPQIPHIQDNKLPH